MNYNEIELEYFSSENYNDVKALRREDISEDWVDGADVMLQLTEYAIEHDLKGHTYAVKFAGKYIGLILLGEAIPWETDPKEMSEEPFYRLMGFVIDRGYRGRGIGGYVLERVISEIYSEYGVRPIALGVHYENKAAERFYERHGFIKTDVFEGSDRYYIRYPANISS